MMGVGITEAASSLYHFEQLVYHHRPNFLMCENNDIEPLGMADDFMLRPMWW